MATGLSSLFGNLWANAKRWWSIFSMPLDTPAAKA
jgi:hypothetical protein